MENENPACVLCNNETIMFRGKGNDLNYMICKDYEKPGHLSKDEIKQKLADARRANMPSSHRWG